MDTVKSQIAQILKTRRKEANLRAKDVLEALKNKGIVISDKTLYGWENGYRQPDADTFLVLCEIYGIDSFTEITSQIPEVESENPHFSHAAQQVALAYDRSDKRTQKIVWTALEDFMETPVPAMAKRRTERAADNSPSMDTWHIRDTYWQETLSQWLKEHPDTSISSGDVPEWVKFNLLRAVNVEGLPGWTREELRQRAERLFEHPRTEQPTVIFSPEIDAQAKRKSSQKKSAQDFAKFRDDKTEHPYCAQCPIAGDCDQRREKTPFAEMRKRLPMVYALAPMMPHVFDTEECPVYSFLKISQPELSDGQTQKLLNGNGTPLLPAGNVDLLSILSMMNPAIQGELSKALKLSDNNGGNGNASEET